jgi:integrase
MQTQPYPEKNGRRCWLSRNEQERIRAYWSDDVEKQLAVDLALHGLRASEVVDVAKDDVRQLDTDTEAYAIQVRDGKTGYRETPLRNDTRQTLSIYQNASDAHQGDALVDVSTRSITRWVQEAAQEAVHDAHADAVGPHDLRRTWATDTFWSLGGGPQVEVTIMNWGGWKLTDTGRQTFRENYLGSIPDHVAVELQERAGLL